MVIAGFVSLILGGIAGAGSVYAVLKTGRDIGYVGFVAAAALFAISSAFMLIA